MSEQDLETILDYLPEIYFNRLQNLNFYYSLENLGEKLCMSPNVLSKILWHCPIPTATINYFCDRMDEYMGHSNYKNIESDPQDA